MNGEYQRQHGGETVFKPLSDLERAINQTSTADFLLFMVTISKQTPAPVTEPELVIGKND
jgi:hypothetical protein